MQRTWRAVVLLVAATLALTGCGRLGEPSRPSTGSPPGAPGVGTAEGQTAPEIEGEDIDGKRFKLSDYRGKVVVLDFWGNW